MDQEDRRAPSVRRVPIATLVEICGQEQGLPNFEAESIEVSGRGMHVRTAYLPDLGAPLVCRFEDRGREILVEGVVAWREEDARGGEFGIKFTALDAGSVDALRDLCGVRLETRPSNEAERREESPGEPPEPAPRGTKVRLHIEGLGSPMKACVRDGTSCGVHVGSNLEFLKVGKQLEIEDTDRGDRRAAHIDAVTVAIDPQTQIPQLVVTLRYDDAPEDATPEPSVIDDRSEVDDLLAEVPPGHSPSSRGPAGAEDDHSDEIAAEAEAMKGRLGRIAVNAGAAMTTAGGKMAGISSRAAVGLGRLLRTAHARVGDKVGDIRQRRAEARPRRTTAPPPSGTLSSRLERRTSTPVTDVQAGSSHPNGSRRRRVIAAAALLGVGVAAGALAMRGDPSAPPPGDRSGGEAVTTVAQVASDVTRVDEQGDPMPAHDERAARDDGVTPQAEDAPQAGGITANVPLFGPTPMATMEPAPLGDAPVQAGEDGDDVSASKSAVPDESWDEAKKARTRRVDPASVKPWGRGKVRTPTIHRIRLDRPGAEIQGAINPTGFTVVIPGRKAMESGRPIAKRDKRIARVRARNTSTGAQIAFQFRDGVPGYRVRLRKDFVEFLISAPRKKK